MHAHTHSADGYRPYSSLQFNADLNPQAEESAVNADVEALAGESCR